MCDVNISYESDDDVVISGEEILSCVWITWVYIEVRIVPSCEAILDSTNHSYPYRGEWLVSETDKRSCHKNGVTPNFI